MSRCVDSILTQSYDKFELLLVDDGSTDGSTEIIKEYEAKDCRIKGLFQGNAGVSSARNLGIENANGDYLIFVDADDYIDSTYLYQFNDYDSDIIICGYSSFGDACELVEPKTETIEGNQCIGSFINETIEFCYIRTRGQKRSAVIW